MRYALLVPHSVAVSSARRGSHAVVVRYALLAYHSLVVRNGLIVNHSVVVSYALLVNQFVVVLLMFPPFQTISPSRADLVKTKGTTKQQISLAKDPTIC